MSKLKPTDDQVIMSFPIKAIKTFYSATYAQLHYVQSVMKSPEFDRADAGQAAVILRSEQNLKDALQLLEDVLKIAAPKALQQFHDTIT